MGKELEEGGDCPTGCGGAMEYLPVEVCSCWISPPCSACVDNPLTCDTCGYEEGWEITSQSTPTPDVDDEKAAMIDFFFGRKQ